MKILTSFTLTSALSLCFCVVAFALTQDDEPREGNRFPTANFATDFGGQDPFGDSNLNVPVPGNRAPNTIGTAITNLDGNLRHEDPMAKAIKELREAETDDEKSSAKETIKEELEKQYDAFLEQNQRQLDQMHDRLKKLEEQVEKRRKAKDHLVDLKLEMLISQAEGLGWPGDNSGWRNNPSPFATGSFGGANFTVPGQNSRPTVIGNVRNTQGFQNGQPMRSVRDNLPGPAASGQGR